MNRKIAVGVLWNLANIFMSRGASSVFTLVLASVLAPQAFGLIAMVTVLFEIAGVFVQSGLGQALIRSKHVTDVDLSTVFLANLGFSALAYIALFLSAPYIAIFYSQPELTLLVKVLGVVVLLNATRVVQVAILSRDMNFKAQTRASVIGVFTSGVFAVSAAYMGAGVWSLVVQMVVSAFVTTVVLWLASRWRPKLVFDLSSFAKFFRFGMHLLAEGVLQVLYENSYVLFIGRLFGAELTGLYFLANKITGLLAKQLTEAVQTVSFPALATLQDDQLQLRHKYRRFIQITMCILAPVMLLLGGVASPLVSVLLDESWQGMVPYIQLLSIVGMLYPLNSLNINIMNVKGRSDLVLKVGVLKKAINLALLIAAIPFGVFAMVASQVVGSLVALLLNARFSAELIEYRLKDQVLDALKPVFAGGLGALSAYGFSATSTLPTVWVLGVSIALAVVVYLITSVVIRGEGVTFLLGKLAGHSPSKRVSA